MIKPLTTLRFFFALMVFASHLSFLAKSDSQLLQWAYQEILSEGYIGVSFFFILSGFIIAHKYKSPLLSKEISVRKFFVARFARIYPLHLLCFILAIPLTLRSLIADSPIWLLKALTNLALVQSFIPYRNIYFSFNTPSWSISNELFFYAVFPLLSTFLLRKLRWKTFVFTLSILPLLMLIVPSEYQHQLFYIHPFTRLLDFTLGVFLFELYQYLNKLKPKVNYTIAEFVAIGVWVLFFVGHSAVPKVMRYSIYYWLPMCLLILTFAFQKGLISKWLSHKWLMLCGEVSFGYYMFHILVLAYLPIINLKFLHITNDYVICLIGAILTFSISYCSFIWFEQPSRAFLKQRLTSASKLKS